jgi:hypothetical protein
MYILFLPRVGLYTDATFNIVLFSCFQRILTDEFGLSNLTPLANKKSRRIL